ncbi:MAG TPA: PhoH family protein [Alphaproteobacteria bacterium]
MTNKLSSAIVDAGTQDVAQLVGGVHEANIIVMEDLLGVTIYNQSPEFKIVGTAEDVANAKSHLGRIIQRAQEIDKSGRGDLREADIESLIMHGGKSSMSKISTKKATLTAQTITQSKYIEAMEKYDVVFGRGPAGTGKTYLAAAYAAAGLERGDYERIILTRPAVEAGERLGFLPGDMKEKVDPYLRPLYDALYDMMRYEEVEKLIASKQIEIAPLAFMRGRTMKRTVMILDEAQNTTAMQMKMFLTRMGEGSKIIVTGDPTQVDLPGSAVSGLVDAHNVLKNVDGIAFIDFTDVDVVRHKMVAKIVKAYDLRDKKKK